MTFAIAALHVLVLFLIAFLIWKKQNGTLGHVFWPALLIKLSAGLLLGMMYQLYYHGGDTFIFFRDATQLSHLFKTAPGAYFKFLWSSDNTQPVWLLLWEIQPRSLFFTKIISVVSILTNDNYWITSLYFSFISFLSSWYVAKKIIRLVPNCVLAAMMSFLFFPSVVFWSSGVIKESMAMASLFLLAGVCASLLGKIKPTRVEWLLVPISIWVLWTLKYYWAVVFLPAAATTWIVQQVVFPGMNSPRSITQRAVWVAVFLLLCSTAMLVHPNFYPEYFLSVIIDNNEAFTTLSEPQNLIHFYKLQPNWASIALNSPWALCSGLVRPFIFEGGNTIKLVYAIENVLVLGLLISSWRNLMKIRTSPFRMSVMAIVVYAAVLCIFLALSTPNFGTLARYRIGFLPFLIFILSYNNPWLEKLATRISRH